MPRVIPIALANHIATGSTTTCVLLRVIPVQPGFIEFGLTTLDVDVHYDDGDGALLYSAPIGSDPSTLQSSADLSVAGGETKQLFDTPVSEADLQAGAYDYAKFIAYLVNYNDLTSGHHIVLQTGTLGRSTVTDSGLAWTSELRGLTQNLKQSITEKWSLSCRAVFGSTGTTAKSRYPCNFDLDSLWSNGTVESVGTDSTQEFSTSGLTAAFGGAPGLVEWLTGANAGRSDECETFVLSDGAGSPAEAVQTVGLTFGASYAIQVGDTFRFRDDCPKTPIACKARGNFQNYRGEPSIPVSDNGAMAVGNVSGIVSASTEIPT